MHMVEFVSISSNFFQFQPGAVEGIVEISALAHAAGKGLKTMVKLLIDNGANVNYLCSVSLKQKCITRVK